jgi:hypothetical protein
MSRGLAVVASALACVAVSTAGAVPGPWQRTEVRESCGSFTALRTPFFGDLHIHTTYSGDAIMLDTRAKPADTYAHAKGGPLGLPPFDVNGVPSRIAQLRRPLDFAAVTDHAEGFGEIDICQTPGLDGYDSSECQGLRSLKGTAIPVFPPDSRFIALLVPYAISTTPARFSWCGTDAVECLTHASLVWQDIQDAAEAHYDRTAACGFTTFVAYEWSATPNGRNLHRNIIFRNAIVPALPTSYLEQQTAEGLRDAIRSDCIDGLPGCDALAIPHNPNASVGLMFAPQNGDGSPLTAASARSRAAMEPLVEMMQHKGSSECRPGAGTTDERCGFESLNRLTLFSLTTPEAEFSPYSYTRTGLLEGLAQRRLLGVNPFQLGFIGSTDTHNGTAGDVNEEDWRLNGHLGTTDATPAFMLNRIPPGGIETNPGGLAVLWAEENSRDALFAAMRRREAYATSGTRPIVRAFAGRFPRNMCNDPEFVRTGYRRGVPMGGELGPSNARRSPRFAILASRDSGDPGVPGTPLERVQMIKGWIDGAGQVHEKVFDVAGGDTDGGVDPATCARTGTGHDQLCAVWRDPEFDASERAFYYVRVLENPTCRWSARLCNDLGVDCTNPSSVPPEYVRCCDTLYARTIQERAWTSPHWYEPEGIARLSAYIRNADDPARGVLTLRARTGGATPMPDLAAVDFSVSLQDDDQIYSVVVPAGTLQPLPGAAGWQLLDDTGAVGGLRRLRVQRSGGGLAIEVRTVPLDLSAADPGEHVIEVHLAAGDWSATHVRLWTTREGRLETR